MTAPDSLRATDGGTEQNGGCYANHEIRDAVNRVRSRSDRELSPLSALVDDLDIDMRPLKDRIEDEMVVPTPDEEAIVDALDGAVGISDETRRLAALNGLVERTGVDRALSWLLGAWAAAELGRGSDVVAGQTLREMVGVATVHTLSEEGWIEYAGQATDIRLRPSRRNEAAQRLGERYVD